MGPAVKNGWSDKVTITLTYKFTKALLSKRMIASVTGKTYLLQKSSWMLVLLIGLESFS
ncbi:MAG: hypothetical protein AB9907_14325 [Flexilinea sp.]